MTWIAFERNKICVGYLTCTLLREEGWEVSDAYLASQMSKKFFCRELDKTSCPKWKDYIPSFSGIQDPPLTLGCVGWLICYFWIKIFFLYDNMIALVTKEKLFGRAQVNKSISEVLIILCNQNLTNHRRWKDCLQSEDLIECKHRNLLMFRVKPHMNPRILGVEYCSLYLLLCCFLLV